MKKTNKKVSDRELNAFSKALGKYLNKNGWKAIVIGPYTIGKYPFSVGDYKYQFVAEFIGYKKL